jgi:hypothetical protein
LFGGDHRSTEAIRWLVVFKLRPVGESKKIGDKGLAAKNNQRRRLPKSHRLEDEWSQRKARLASIRQA